MMILPTPLSPSRSKNSSFLSRKIGELHSCNIGRLYGRSAVFLSLIALLLVATTGYAQARPGSRNIQANLGVINQENASALVLGVPMFRPASAKDAVLPGGIFREAIYPAASAPGVFRRAASDSAVENALNRWAKSGRRDVKGFSSAGVEIACIGTYSVEAGQLTAEVRALDATDGGAIFAKKYSGFTADNQGAQRLARAVANDLLQYIGHEEGLSDSRIAFVSNRSGNKELWVMAADGSQDTQITNEKALVMAPCFGARGGEFYFTSYRRYNPDLYGMLADRSKGWLISEKPGSNMSPAWSEANQKLAMVLMKDGNSEIYTCDRGGRNLQRLTRHRAIDASPSWSPDGSKIAFTSNRTGSPQIYTMNADGSGIKRITFKGSYNTAPAWSPDGSKIAYVGRVSGSLHIHVLDLASGNSRKLTSGNHNNEDPTWAPNAQYLAFTSDRSGPSQIYRMRADGSSLVQLTRQGVNSAPSWGPKYNTGK